MQRCSDEKSFIDSAYSKRGIGPDWYENGPEVLPGDELFLSGFWELNTCRPIGMARGPIPWTAIDRYCQRHEFEAAFADLFHDAIRAMDVAFLKYAAKQGGKGGSKPAKR